MINWRNFLLLSLFLAVLIASWILMPKDDLEGVSVSPAEIILENLSIGETRDFEIQLVNNTSRLVTTASVRTSCGCISDLEDKNMAEVGGVAFIPGKFLAEDTDKSKTIEKTILLSFDGDVPPAAVLLFAQVRTAIRLNEGEVVFSALDNKKSVSVFRENLTPEQFKRLSFELNHPTFKVVSHDNDGQRLKLQIHKNLESYTTYPATLKFSAINRVGVTETYQLPVVQSLDCARLKPNSFFASAVDSRESIETFRIVDANGEQIKNAKILSVQLLGEDSEGFQVYGSEENGVVLTVGSEKISPGVKSFGVKVFYEVNQKKESLQCSGTVIIR